MKKIEFLAASLPSDLKINVIDDERKTTYIETLHASRFHSFATFSYYQPIIRHIDTLTQECVQADYNNGKPFIPIVELARIAFPQYCIKFEDGRVWVDTDWDIASFNFNGKDFVSDIFRVFNQLQLFQHLLKFHFWPNKPDGEDVVYVSDDFNPYK